MGSALTQSQVALEILIGSVSNDPGIDDAALDAEYEIRGGFRCRSDTKLDILGRRGERDWAFRVGLSRPYAHRLRHDDALTAHAWPRTQWPTAPYRLTGDGADHPHTAFAAMYERIDGIRDHLRLGHSAAVRAVSGTVSGVVETSLVSATGHAGAVLYPFAARPLLADVEGADNSTLALVAMIQGPADGAGSHLARARQARSYAALASIDAMTVELQQRTRNNETPVLHVPDVGVLQRQPYDIVFVASAPALHAGDLEGFVRATRLLTLILSDRTDRGLGAMVAEDWIRITANSGEFPPVEIEVRRNGSVHKHTRSKVFALPCVQKVTLDRRAIAIRAARYDTLAVLRRLGEARAEGGRSRELQRLFDYRRVYEAVKPTDLPAEREKPTAHPERDASEAAARAVEVWADGGGPERLRAELRRHLATCLSQRLADGTLGELPKEFNALATVLARMAGTAEKPGDAQEQANSMRDEARVRLQGELSGTPRSLFERIFSVPASRKLERVTKAANDFAKAEFWRSWTSYAASALRETHDLCVQRGSGFGRGFSAELVSQTDSDGGAYTIAVTGGWNEFRSPAPNIHRLYGSREAFEALYFGRSGDQERPGLSRLQVRLPAGEVVLDKNTFTEVVRSDRVAAAVMRALGEGREGFGRLAETLEAHFRPLYEDALGKWFLKAAADHLAPEEERRRREGKPSAEGVLEVLADANERVRPEQYVMHHTPQPEAQQLYAELPDDEPDKDWLERVVRGLGNYKILWRKRQGEAGVILLGVAGALTLDDIAELGPDSEARRLFLELDRRSRAEGPPVFASRYLQCLASKFDDELQRCPPDRPLDERGAAGEEAPRGQEQDKVGA